MCGSLPQDIYQNQIGTAVAHPEVEVQASLGGLSKPRVVSI